MLIVHMLADDPVNVNDEDLPQRYQWNAWLIECLERF